MVTHTVQAVPALSYGYSHYTGGPGPQPLLHYTGGPGPQLWLLTLYRRSRPSAVVTHTVQAVPALSHCYSSCLISVNLRAFPEVYSIYPKVLLGEVRSNSVWLPSTVPGKEEALSNSQLLKLTLALLFTSLLLFIFELFNQN